MKLKNLLRSYSKKFSNRNVKIMPSRVSDIPSILELHHDLFSDILMDMNYYNVRNLEAQAQWGRIIVAKEKGVLVGYGASHTFLEQPSLYESISKRVQGGFFEKSFPPASDKDTYFSELGIHPDFRRRGIGTMITKERIKTARKKGASAVYVECLVGSGSVKMYEDLGFSHLFYDKELYPNGQDMQAMGLIL